MISTKSVRRKLDGFCDFRPGLLPEKTCKVEGIHAQRRGWTNTFNVWAGPGGWQAAPAKVFRVTGVPTCYIIDPDGKIAWAGHPAGLRLADEVEPLLEHVQGPETVRGTILIRIIHACVNIAIRPTRSALRPGFCRILEPRRDSAIRSALMPTDDSSETALDGTLHEQVEYYCARAVEYNQWWLRQGRYDRGAQLNARWRAEGKRVQTALDDFKPSGRILEIACGTGIWTERLLPFAREITALDASPEMLQINAARVRSERVRHIQANVFSWRPTDRFDTVFFGFWLSHVPPERFAAFWETVRSCLAPRGRVFFVDSRHETTSTALDHRLPDKSATVSRRRLNDGREFQVYKIFYEPAELTCRLLNLGWDIEVCQTDHYFIYGHGQDQQL